MHAFMESPPPLGENFIERDRVRERERGRKRDGEDGRRQREGENRRSACLSRIFVESPRSTDTMQQTFPTERPTRAEPCPERRRSCQLPLVRTANYLGMGPRESYVRAGSRAVDAFHHSFYILFALFRLRLRRSAWVARVTNKINVHILSALWKHSFNAADLSR